MRCREGCGACCIAPSIASSIPGMPDGKPAGSSPWHLMTYEFRIKPGGGAAPKPLAAKAAEVA